MLVSRIISEKIGQLINPQVTQRKLIHKSLKRHKYCTYLLRKNSFTRGKWACRVSMNGESKTLPLDAVAAKKTATIKANLAAPSLAFSLKRLILNSRSL